MPKQTLELGRRWYALHTYSGYEENVTQNLKQRIESMGMEDRIFNILVPTEKKIKIKSGKRKVIEEKIFPCYVLRNTPNVTGFVGSGTTPTPISEEEIKGLMKRMQIEEPKYTIDVAAGDPVQINDRPFKGFYGKVS